MVSRRNFTGRVAGSVVVSACSLHRASAKSSVDQLGDVGGKFRFAIIADPQVSGENHRGEVGYNAMLATEQTAREINSMEPHHPFQPMQRFVTVSFMSKGIGEYEVIDDADRTLAVTLLRTTRVTMKANRGQMTPEELERSNGHQLQGKFEYEYAITAHAGNWETAGVHLMADDFRSPVRVLQGVPKVGKLPVKHSMLEIEKNKEIQVSALCRTEEGATILRLWNSSSEPVETKLMFNADFQCLEKIDLAETAGGEKVPMVGNSAVLKFQPLEIQTLRFK